MEQEQHWKTCEKVVTIIERHLDQSARVRRDVHLPVLLSLSGRTRQCDIVVEQGQPPRQTVSIVEVQKREAKPEINDFNGWLEKMREVGAQHLICVSELGFPSSIEEKADQIGPTVRLLTLQRLESPDGWPLHPRAFCGTLLVVRYDRLCQLVLDYVHLVRRYPNERLPNPVEDRVFRTPDGHLLTVSDLTDWHLFGNPSNLEELPVTQSFVLGVRFGPGLAHKTGDGQWINLNSLLIQTQMFISSHQITWSAQTYEQRGWGEIAWVLRAKATVGEKTFDVIVPLRRAAPGEYRVGRPIAIGDFHAFLALGDMGIRADTYTDEN